VCAKKTANERAQERKKNNNKKREIRVSIFINLIFFQLLNQTLPIIYLFIFKTGEKYMFSSLIQFVLFVMFIFFSSILSLPLRPFVLCTQFLLQCHCRNESLQIEREREMKKKKKTQEIEQ